ncbi:MAG: hypothetical protein ACTS4U_00645 [Candidatus Hodgkinia cicadicola]
MKIWFEACEGTQGNGFKRLTLERLSGRSAVVMSDDGFGNVEALAAEREVAFSLMETRLRGEFEWNWGNVRCERFPQRTTFRQGERCLRVCEDLTSAGFWQFG